MILLSTVDLVRAVRASLEAHVAPALGSEFASVQLAAALIALAEVEARVEGADPCAVEGARLLDGLRGIAAGSTDAGWLAEELAAVESVADHRERDRRLRQIVADLALGDDGALADGALALLTDNGMKTAAEDGVWVCKEAVASLQ